MKPLSAPLSFQSCSIFRLHLFLSRQLRFPTQHRRERHCLELEERESGREIRYADESEGWVGDVEDIFVEVVALCAVGYKNGVRGLAGRGSVGMEMGEKGKGDVVACAEDYAVDVG